MRIILSIAETCICFFSVTKLCCCFVLLLISQGLFLFPISVSHIQHIEYLACGKIVIVDKTSDKNILLWPLKKWNCQKMGIRNRKNWGKDTFTNCQKKCANVMRLFTLKTGSAGQVFIITHFVSQNKKKYQSSIIIGACIILCQQALTG